MELRGCSSHLHYIQAIKHGSIVKTINVGSRGKPALVLKKVEDIYETEDSKSLHSLPASQPKDEFRGAFFGRDRFDIDSPCSSIEEGNSIKTDSETCEISCNTGDDQQDGDSDDLSCDKMTLNQLKDMGRAKIDPNTCQISCNEGEDQIDSDSDDLNCDKMTLNQLKHMAKRKKRKHSVYVDFTKLDGKNCTTLKEEDPNLQSMEDDIDLKVPLSCLKSKPSKRKKSCINKYVYSFSQSGTAILVKSEEVSSDHSLPHCIGYVSAPADVKIEILEADNSDCPSVVSLADDSSVGCDKQVASNVKNNEMLETADKSVFENGESFLFTEQKCCVVNEVSYDHLEHAEIVSLPDVTDISSETMKVDDSEINIHQSLVLPLKELNEKENISHPPFHDIYQEMLYPAEDHNSSVYDSSHCYSIPHEISQQEKASDEVQQSGNAVNASIQCLPSDGGGVCVSGNEKDNFSCKLNTEGESSPMSNCSSPNESNPCLSPDNFLTHVNDDSPTVEKKQSLTYVGGYPTKKSSAGVQFCDTSNELSTSELAANCHHPELQHPPERLFSNRKAISPTSQEKLCKAMNAIDIHDDIELYKCREKLCFQKQTQSKASSEIEESEVDVKAEGPEQTSRAEVTINCKAFKRRPKNCSKGSHPKGILKVHQLSRSVPRVSTGCTSIQSCSRSAIAFSQRQMQDIEGLAMKLTKELNSMKNIVEDALQSEPCISPTLKYNSDEVKTAIGNARKVEETAKKWLSIMARDCNRFCKIMSLNENNDNTDSGTSISKQRKKITFADEAGEKLCQVKVFEEDTTVSTVL